MFFPLNIIHTMTVRDFQDEKYITQLTVFFPGSTKGVKVALCLLLLFQTSSLHLNHTICPFQTRSFTGNGQHEMPEIIVDVLYKFQYCLPSRMQNGLLSSSSSSSPELSVPSISNASGKDHFIVYSLD